MLFLGPSTQIHFLCTLHSPTSSHLRSASLPSRPSQTEGSTWSCQKQHTSPAWTPVLPFGWCIISQVIQAGHWRRLSFLLPLHQELPKLNQLAVCPFSWSQFSLCSYSHQRHLIVRWNPDLGNFQSPWHTQTMIIGKVKDGRISAGREEGILVITSVQLKHSISSCWVSHCVT